MEQRGLAQTHGIAFLMFHELERAGCALLSSDPGYVRYAVREADFRVQMAGLREAGFKGATVSEALRESELDDRKLAVITFDDGCETDLTVAAPVLREAAFGATFFVTVDWINRAGHLTAPQLRELAAAGFEIGCHSLSHPHLPALSEQALAREIGEAKSRLEDLLGARVNHFACPGGGWDRRVARTAYGFGYESVSTSVPRTNRASDDRFRLGRIPVLRGTPCSALPAWCRGRGLFRLRAGNQVRAMARACVGASRYDQLRRSLLR